MRIVLPIVLFFCAFTLWSQEDIYFLINQNDSLIKTQISTEPNTYAGYEIFYDTLIRVKKNRTPGPAYQRLSPTLIKIKEEDPLYDYFEDVRPAANFSFIKEDDRFISEDELKEFNVICERTKLLSLGSGGFDNGNFYYFLEKMENGKYLIREVHPVIFE